MVQVLRSTAFPGFVGAVHCKEKTVKQVMPSPEMLLIVRRPKRDSLSPIAYRLRRNKYTLKQIHLKANVNGVPSCKTALTCALNLQSSQSSHGPGLSASF